MSKKRTNRKKDKWQQVLIATFSPWKDGIRLPINGNVEPMLDYFVPRSTRVVLIDQVYPGSDFVMPKVEIYEKGTLVRVTHSSPLLYLLYPFLRLVNTGATHIVFKIRDYFSVLFEGLRAKKPFDLCIGFEAINALSGVLLRRLGKVKTVVYYVSDYSPKRYKNTWFNALYLWLDRQAAMHSDVIWDVSKAMMPARVAAGLDPQKAAPNLHVPNALYPSQISPLPATKVQQYSVVFLGTLGYENGPDIAVRAIALVVRKIPSVVLHIIGGNEPNEKQLKLLAKELGIARHVRFHGFISDRENISALARTFQLALAPYKNIEGSARKYGDATKIRAYVAAGLPVITTDVPPLGKDIQKAGAGLIVDDSPEAFAEAIISVLQRPKKYIALRNAAIRFAKHNTWENEFAAALSKMGK